MTPREFDLLRLDTLLTIEAVAALLKIPTSWLYERTSQGTIPHLNLAKVASIGPYDTGIRALQRLAI
jgi:predicted DNA-binding transcriptional regulator AlpA